MDNTVNILRWVVRLCGVIALLMGLGFWAGHGNPQLVQMHQGLGYLVALALLAVSVMAFGKRGVPAGMAAAGVVWALLVPALGHMQTRLLPGSSHWIVEVLHLLLGVGAIGLTEGLAGRMKRAALSAPDTQRVQDSNISR